MIKPLIFAGTTEGKEIALFFNKEKIYANVYTATEYGVEVLPEMEYISTYAGRLTYEEMVTLFESMQNEEIIVIDATHPYAGIVTDNLYKACTQVDIPYYRLLRPSTYNKDEKTFESIEEAVEYLKTTKGNILLATGSKELAKYKEIDSMERLFPRVLPDKDVIKNILDLGYMQKNIICMQGPFSVEMNIATLKQIKGAFLVTKDTGTAGGFNEKLEAAKSSGAELIVISRPKEMAQGYTQEQLQTVIKEKYLSR